MSPSLSPISFRQTVHPINREYQDALAAHVFHPETETKTATFPTLHGELQFPSYEISSSVKGRMHFPAKYRSGNRFNVSPDRYSVMSVVSWKPAGIKSSACVTRGIIGRPIRLRRVVRSLETDRSRVPRHRRRNAWKTRNRNACLRASRVPGSNETEPSN